MAPFDFADTAHAAELAKDFFGISGTIQALDSYADKNFRIEDSHGNRYVLKLTLSETDKQAVAMQNQVLDHLAVADAGVAVPRVIRAISGEDLIELDHPSGRKIAMRMLSFLPGQLWYQIESASEAFLTKVGAFLGNLDKAMASFEHPSSQRYLIWDLRHAMDAFKHSQTIEDPRRRYWAQYLLNQFDAVVMAYWDQLPQQVIHNDCNDYNLLVARNQGDWFPNGLIDFGDMVYTARVCEPAIAAAYAVLEKQDPLAAAAALIAGYHQVNPLTDEELKVMFHLIRARLVVSVCMSAFRKTQEPDNAYLLVTEAPAWRAIEKLMAIKPAEAHAMFRQACGLTPKVEAGHSPQVLLKLRRKHLGKSLSVAYKKPLKIVQGHRQYLIDYRDLAYLDCVNNVCHVGHCHPHVVKAATQQMALLNTNTRYLHDHIVALAEKLTATLPDLLNVVFFVNSGSEANDLAMRMARHFTGSDEILAVDAGYHGNLSSLIGFSHYKFDGPGGKGPAAWARTVPLPDGYRGPIRGHGSEAGAAYGATVASAVNDIQSEGKTLAAFFCESLPGCGGQIVLPQNYLKHAYAAVRAGGGLCIADEVQVGFGRVGEAFWGFELQGVVPDIVTMGKPFGNGHPLAALVTTAEIAKKFANGMEYFNTFGGNPVSCAVGLAVMETIENEGLQEKAAALGRFLLKEFGELQAMYPQIGEVRGSGFFLGLEMVVDPETREPDASLATQIVNRMRDKSILLSTDGPDHNVIKFKPPMSFHKANAMFLVNTLTETLQELLG